MLTVNLLSTILTPLPSATMFSRLIRSSFRILHKSSSNLSTDGVRVSVTFSRWHANFFNNLGFFRMSAPVNEQG